MAKIADLQPGDIMNMVAFVTFSEFRQTNGNSRLTLIEHGVHHRLHLTGGADAHRRVDRDADQPKGLGVGFNGTRGDPAAAETLCIVLVEADHPPDGLGDADVIHRAHEQHRFQTRNVDTLAENAVVQNHKLLRVILTPCTQSVKEPSGL